ncbi:MAG: hypothetical protein OHK93_004293 [Ramalina farinacea]|uniref:Uncharacterized protein n=1 Tax=Ramalina farinacea TaxID=258253 RepID=A0AA43QGI2_9LECA|nr:hypothetical protein [Ramalina farinacea]
MFIFWGKSPRFPFRLIWKGKLRYTHKLALALMLCLTIIVNFIALAGIHTNRGTVPSIDPIRELYWQYLAANNALTMRAATAFRTFFLSKTQHNVRKSPCSQNSTHSKLRGILRVMVDPYSWRSKYIASSTRDYENQKWPRDEFDLPPLDERATMTGIRTFLHQRGKPSLNESSIMNSVHAEMDDWQPQSTTPDRTKPAIYVEHGFFVHVAR